MNKDSTPMTDLTNIAVINTNISYIQKDLAEIKSSIKELSGVYATKVFVDDALKAIDLRSTKIEAASNLWKWLSPTISAALAALLMFLVQQYLTHLK